jgi:hypothetical protein
MASALLLEMEADAFWCNPADKAARANNKPLQLAQARAVGLAIPQTLFSNDPDAIRAFHARYAGNVIFKPFLQPQWLNASTTYSYFTSVLPASALDQRNSLRHCPGIYQPRIDKRHELRVTMVGRHVFATRIDSQASRTSALDWRQDLLQQCPLSDITLPPALVERCHALMARLGLVFGCIDFIVTPQGDYVFLEVNEMGQFLWIEERCPSTRLLDAFTQMLIQGRPDFDWQPGARPDVSYGAFLAFSPRATPTGRGRCRRCWSTDRERCRRGVETCPTRALDASPARPHTDPMTASIRPRATTPHATRLAVAPLRGRAIVPQPMPQVVVTPPRSPG